MEEGELERRRESKQRAEGGQDEQEESEDRREGRRLLTILYDLIREVSANETFGIEDGISRIHSCLILGSLTDETFTTLCESDIRRQCTIPLFISDNIHHSTALS